MLGAQDRQSDQERADAADEEAVRPLLARANLLRMRQQWDDAVTACTEALHRAPRSANAHALLGNIYEGQGKYEDAIEWYVMASEIRPLGPADSVQLQQLLEVQRARLRTDALSNTQPLEPKPVGEKTLEWFDRIFPPGRSDGMLRLILALAASIAVVIAVCAAFIYIYVSPKKEEAVADAVQAGQPDTLIASAPIVMTPSASRAAVSSHAAAAESPTPSPDAVTPSRTQTSGVSSSEIRDKVAQALEGGGASISALTILPDSSTLAIDITLPSVHLETPEHLRERTIRVAGVAMHAAALAAPDSVVKTVLRIGADSASPPLAVANLAASQGSRSGATVIFAASALLRPFRDTNIGGLPTSDLIAHFDAVQWHTALANSSAGGGGSASATSGVSENPKAGTTTAAGASPSPVAVSPASTLSTPPPPAVPSGPTQPSESPSPPS